VAYVVTPVTLRLKAGYAVTMVGRAMLGKPAVKLPTVSPMMPYATTTGDMLHQGAHVAPMQLCDRRDGRVVGLLTVFLRVGRVAVIAATPSQGESVAKGADPVLLGLAVRSSMEVADVVLTIRLLWTATSVLLVRQWWGDRQHVVPSRGPENPDQPVRMQEQAYEKA
jgi:hypothetical protein